MVVTHDIKSATENAIDLTNGDVPNVSTHTSVPEEAPFATSASSTVSHLAHCRSRSPHALPAHHMSVIKVPHLPVRVLNRPGIHARDPPTLCSCAPPRSPTLCHTHKECIVLSLRITPSLCAPVFACIPPTPTDPPTTDPPTTDPPILLALHTRTALPSEPILTLIGYPLAFSDILFLEQHTCNCQKCAKLALNAIPENVKTRTKGSLDRVRTAIEDLRTNAPLKAGSNETMLDEELDEVSTLTLIVI
jgi:hypothetical protein